MGFLNEFFGLPNNNVEWLAIKATGKVYPKPAISVLKLTSKSGKVATGWLDKSYEQYEYKRFSPYNLLVQVVLPKEPAETTDAIDTEAIPNFFITELRRVSIAQLVARIVASEELTLEIYVEQKPSVIKLLDKLEDNPLLFQSFTYEIVKDARWIAVSRLMKL